MTTTSPPKPELAVQYKVSADSPETKQTTLKVVLADYLDGTLPPTAVVDLTHDGRFLPIGDVLRTHPSLIENRSTGVQILLALSPLIMAIPLDALGLLQGSLATKVHLLALLLTFLAALWLRYFSPLRGRSSLAHLKHFWGGTYRKPVLLGIVIVEASVVLSSLASRSQTRHGVASLEATLNDPDPCAVRKLDRGLIQQHAGEELRRRIIEREAKCDDREMEVHRQARAMQQQQGCKQIVAALQAKQPVDIALIPDDKNRLLAERLGKNELRLGDLESAKADMPCDSETLWPLFVEAVRASPIWSSMAAPPKVSEVLRAELEKKKLAPEVGTTFKGKVEALATASQTKAIEEMEPAMGLCRQLASITTESSPACKTLEAKYRAGKAQQEQQAKAKEAQCVSLRLQSATCLRRCDDLLLSGGNDDGALKCEERCNKTFDLKGCP